MTRTRRDPAPGGLLLEVRAALSFWLMALTLSLSGGTHAQEPIAPPSTEVASLPSHPRWMPPKERVPGRALLRLLTLDEHALREATKQGTEPSRELARILDEIGARTGHRLTLVRPMQFGWALYDVGSADGAPALDEEETGEAVSRLRADKAVAAASDDRWMRPLRTPNDSYLSYMWHLDAIRARVAWDSTIGAAEQRVGVVDSGTVRNHLDLSAKDLAGYDFISMGQVANDGEGRDADYNDPGDGGDCGYGYQPSSWHGSHVAGTILASTNNGAGISGINWNARLVTARALGVCGGSESDILEAMAWLAGYVVEGVPSVGGNAVQAINLSLGIDGPCSSAEQEYISTIVEETGTVFVAAAGNSGNHVPVGSPANCDGAIAVGAYGPGSGRPLASYSNFGTAIDIVAPGGEMETAQEEGVLSACGEGTDCYTFQQGTSMAAPHVTGVVSLMLAVNPSLSPAQVLSLLVETGESCSGCGSEVALRADLAVQAAGGTPGEGGGGTCSAACDALEYNACTCGSDDPCGWIGDGYCDAECAQVLSTPFDDSGDCTGGSDAGGSGGNTGGGTGGGSAQDVCDLRRGNWDCPNGRGCVDDGSGDDLGRCEVGAEGDTGSGGLCDDGSDCESGLCDRGVCTVPCSPSGQCREGYACEEDAIPGGLCRPESCLESRGDICPEDWLCTYTDESRYVCAVEGEPAFGQLCMCTGVRPHAPWAALALIGMALLLRRRRR